MDRRYLLSYQDETVPTAPHPALFYAGVPPPPRSNYPQPPNNTPVRHWRIPAISAELAREVFIDYAANNFCYSSKPAKQMTITELLPLHTYRYQLETFTETRSSEWASEPYNGQLVDSMNGVAPGPWDISVPVPTLFLHSETSVQIPFTSSIKGCESCLNLGKSACKNCLTSGKMKCKKCNGFGITQTQDRCPGCAGSGVARCGKCAGKGSIECKTCKGKGKLFCYLKLKIKWENNKYVRVMDKLSGFPADLLGAVHGETLLTDMNMLVYPVTNFPDEAINAASRQAVQEHKTQFSTSARILQQRQTIELIPVTRVNYTWKEKTNIYFVYGNEHQVYSKEYPAKYLCCTIC